MDTLMESSLTHGKRLLKIPFRNPFLEKKGNTRALDLGGVLWERLAIAPLVNKDFHYENKIFSLFGDVFPFVYMLWQQFA